MLEHMGDVVSVEPLIREAKHRQPDAHLTFAVSPVWRPLVEHHPHVDHVVEIPSLGEWIYLSPGELFDTVHDLQTRGRWCPRTDLLLHRSDVAAMIDIHNYYHHGPLLYAASVNGGFGKLSDLGVDLQPRLHLPDGLDLPVALPRGDYAVLHTTSNQPERDWNPGGWQRLARHLEERHGLAIVIVGGHEASPVEVHGAIDLREQLGILQTARVIGGARLFVGIDSGPAHLANAMGTDGLVLLGHYRDFRRYCPYTGRFATSLHHHAGPASQTPLEPVTRRLDDLLRGKGPTGFLADAAA